MLENSSDSSGSEDSNYEEINQVVVINKLQSSVTAAMVIEKSTTADFELNTGASCNLISTKHLMKSIKYTLERTRTVLKMYDGNLVYPEGRTKLKIINPKNRKKYLVQFEVVK